MHQDSRGYWYRSRREGQRVTREYVGAGAVIGMCAQIEALEQERAQEARASEQAAWAKLAVVDETIDAFCDATGHVMRASFQAAGYHQHDRGEWRKRRRGNSL